MNKSDMLKNYKGSNLITSLIIWYARSVNHPLKIRIINALIKILNPDGIILKGINRESLRVSPTNYIGHQIIYSGFYESKSLTLTLELLNSTDNPVFVDIGANMGLYSLPISKVKGSTVYAIEPTAKNFWKLQQNFNLNNNLTNNIHLINIALSNKTEFSYISNPVDGNDGTFRVETNPSKKSYLTNLTTFDNIIQFYNINNIDVLKIDVEGYEGKVFDGFKMLNQLKPKNIIMEFSDYVERVGYSKLELYDRLQKLGYEGLTIEGQNIEDFNNLIEDNIWFKLK